MKNFTNRFTPVLTSFSLSLFTICLLFGVGINKVEAQTNTGIWDTYLLLGSAPNTYFVDGTHTQYPTAVAFNQLNLGNFSAGGTLTLAGGDDFTAKVTAHANICSGMLYYSVYPINSGPTTWDSIALNYTGSYGNVVLDSATDQEWSTASNDSNILSGLVAGTYKLQVYFTSTGSSSSTGSCSQVFTENNSGANYTATFTVGDTTLIGAGIWDTYVLIGASPNSASSTTYFVDGTHSQDPSATAFNNSYLGAFITTDTLNLAGGEDFTYKVATHGNVCGGILYYSVYPTGSSPTSYVEIDLGYTGSYGNVTIDSLTNQEWSTTTNITNILAGLPAGDYNLQVYFTSTGSDSSTGNCNQTYIEANGGADYTANFTIDSPAVVVPGAGIWDTYILLGSGPTTYFVDGVHTQDPGAADFNGSNLGSFTTADTLNLAGGEDFTFKSTAHGNVCSGTLYYNVYPSSGTPGTFNPVALSYTNSYGNVVVDSLTDQEWSNTSNITNILSGLNPGTYELQVYFSSTGSDTSGSICTTTYYESNGGDNYTANFTLTYPLGVNNIPDGNNWLVYPEPFSSQLNINTGSLITKADKIELIDVLGREVYTATEVTGNPIELNLPNLQAGTYFVRVTTAQGSFVKAVVKE